MPYSLHRQDERSFRLVNECFQRYGVRLTPLEGKLLQLLVDLRCATTDRIDEECWPDFDPTINNIASSRTVAICKIRKKFGKLIELATFHGQGYALQRLGPEDNPIHERNP